MYCFTRYLLFGRDNLLLNVPAAAEVDSLLADVVDFSPPSTKLKLSALSVFDERGSVLVVVQLVHVHGGGLNLDQLNLNSRSVNYKLHVWNCVVYSLNCNTALVLQQE